MARYDQYIQGGIVRGHYAAAQRSGEIAATLAALGHLARIRWTDGTVSCVLKRIKVGVTVSAAITAAVEMAFRAIIVRGFTTDFTTAITNVAPTKLRGTMQGSLMGAAGPGICTTAVLSGQTLTADAAPFAAATLANPSSTLGASAVTNQIGAGSPMTTLYEVTSDGQHPVVLAQNEGIVIQPVNTGPATGTFAIYTQWEWAEVLY